MKKCLHLFERQVWFAHIPAVHRNICCWLEGYSSVCKAKCLHEQISPLCLLVSLPQWSFPGAKWSSLREETICVLSMLRGIKPCSWELISVPLLSCLDAGVGFVVVPGKLAGAAGPCEVMLGCGWSSSPLLLSCRRVFALCRNVSLSEKQHFSCRQWQ